VRSLLQTTALILSLLIAMPAQAAAIGTAPEKAPSAAAAQPEQIGSTKIAITPHRAIYDMSLTSVKNGSNIAGVSGHMLFEWADVCDGWAIQQHLKLHFSYAEGDESDVTSTEVTWESKDGKRYSYNVRRVTDGKETENYRGKATLEDKGGEVTYTVPEGKTAKLPPGSLFPTAHTETILQKALAGERFFTRRVFDGSDDVGSNDVSVFIDPPKAHWLTTEADPKLKQNPLLDETAWPVRMAFFKIDTETGEPDYEMDLTLLANGVARSMRIDYGDFSVTGNLSAIEPLPAPHCQD
jgi:hypothetical protein